jgi:hypothetical protein
MDIIIHCIYGVKDFLPDMEISYIEALKRISLQGKIAETRKKMKVMCILRVGKGTGKNFP